MTTDRATIWLTTAPTLMEAVASLLPVVRSLTPPIVLASANDRTGEDGGLGPVLRAAFGARYRGPRDVRIVSPPTLKELTWQRIRHRRAESVEVDLRGRGGRLSSVRLATPLAEAATLIAVNDLRGESGDHPTIALGIWGRYTHGRDRIALQLSAADRGAAAEIALAVRPALIVLAVRWRNRLVVAMADDQIAAELAGLALRQLSKVEEDEPVGPWEDALVQRATELQLGVLLPDRLTVKGIVPDLGAGDELSQKVVTELAEVLALRLGVVTITVQ